MSDRESSYEIEFDEHGRIRVRDAELAHRILRIAGAGDGIEIVIDARPVETPGKEWTLPLPAMNAETCPGATNAVCPKPLNATGCPVPSPIDGDGCPNSICPFTGIVRIAKPVVAQWQRRSDADAGGGECEAP